MNYYIVINRFLSYASLGWIIYSKNKFFILNKKKILLCNKLHLCFYNLMKFQLFFLIRQILNRQHNQLEALSNRDAQNLDILINEIIKRVKQSKLMQTEIEMNGEILRTVKTADKSNPKNYAMETTKGKEFVQVTDEAVDPELNKIFIETTNGNKKKEEEGVKEKIYSKVKFQDQYSDLENLNKDRDR